MRLATSSTRGPLLLRAALVVCAVLVAAALVASQGAMLHCGANGGTSRGLPASAGSDAAAAAAAAGGAAQQTAAAAQGAESASTQQRHARPPELDAPADTGTLGLAAARAAAAADAALPVSQPGVIPRILHRIYIADPNDEKR